MKWFPWTADFFTHSKTGCKDGEFDLKKAVRTDCIIYYRPYSPELAAKVTCSIRQNLPIELYVPKEVLYLADIIETPDDKVFGGRLSFYVPHYMEERYIIYHLLKNLKAAELTYECWKSSGTYGGVLMDMDNFTEDLKVKEC